MAKMEKKADVTMTWHSVADALPSDGDAVLVRYAWKNWHMANTVKGGVSLTHWRWATARFGKGNDGLSNNLRDYAWETFGDGDLFGQDVTHWAHIYDPMNGDDDHEDPIFLTEGDRAAYQSVADAFDRALMDSRDKGI